MAAQLFSAALRMMQSLIDEQSGLTGTQNQPNPTAHPCTGNISEGFREPKPLHLRHSVLAYHLLLSVSEGAMPRWAFPFALLLGGLAGNNISSGQPNRHNAYIDRYATRGSTRSTSRTTPHCMCLRSMCLTRSPVAFQYQPVGLVQEGIHIGVDYCNDLACSMMTADSIATPWVGANLYPILRRGQPSKHYIARLRYNRSWSCTSAARTILIPFPLPLRHTLA